MKLFTITNSGYRRPPFFKYCVIILICIGLVLLAKRLLNSDFRNNVCIWLNEHIRIVNINTNDKLEVQENNFDDENQLHRNDSESGLYYYYQNMSKEDKKICNTLLMGIMKLDDEIYLQTNDMKKISDILEKIECDHPEIFWTNGYKISSIGDKSYIYPKYVYDINEVERRKNQIEESIQNIVSEMKKLDDDYDKAKLAYEYIIDTVDYSLNSEDNQNLYSSLVNHESVCAGYAKGLQYLLQKVGIQSLLVSGSANNDDGWGPHAWNIIKYKNDYYHIDSTFADPSVINNEETDRVKTKGTYNYSYFFTTDSLIFNNHKYEKNTLNLPKCNSMNDEYFIREGLYSDKYTVDVYNHMQSTLEDNKSFIWQFSNKNELKNFLKRKDFMKILNGNTNYNTASYSYDESMYTVKIDLIKE